MHASGIRVDEASKAEFARAAQDASTGFLQYRIAADTFKKVGSGPAGNGAQDTWAAIRQSLEQSPQEPSFVVARNVSKEANKWLLLFYMPEGCTVRDRMVYAASSAALKDGLGQSNFDAATYSISHPREASADEYTNVSRNMSHDELLTLDEKEKRDGEMQSALSMGSARTLAIVGLPIKASDEALAAITEVQKGSPSTLILLLNAETEVLQVQQSGNFTLEQVQGMLPPTEPRYVLHNFAHEHEGKQTSAFVFAYYCPDDIKPKLKMFYSTCKQVVVKVCEQLGVTVTRSLELSEPKELASAAVLEELYPQAQAKKVFKKPARPGRGNARLLGADGNALSPNSASSAAAASPSP